MAVAICRSSWLDLLVERLDRRDQAQDQRSADAELELADPGLGRAPELCQQLARASGRRSSAGAPGTPAGAARPDRARPRGSGSARGTRARSGCRRLVNRPIGPGQNRSSSARSWLHQRGPGAHQILPRPGQRSRAPWSDPIRLEHPEAVAVGARQLAQHERVEPVGLPARGPEPRRASPRPGWDATAAPAAPRPAAARPAARPAARSRPASPRPHAACGTTPAAPASSCANVAASSSSPVSSAIATSCFSDAQSTPA